MSEKISIDDFIKISDETLEKEYRSASLKKIHHDQSTGAFRYIAQEHAYQLYTLFSQAETIIKKNTWGDKDKFQVTFLDIGCGTGRILRLAKLFGFKVKGVEFHKPYLDYGKKVYRLTDEELFCMDAFDMTPEFLSGVNLAYTYMPMRDAAKMSKLHIDFYTKLPACCLVAEMYPLYYPMNSLNPLWKENNFSGKIHASFSCIWKNYVGSGY